MTFRYGALVRSLWSLRGDPHIADVTPTERGVPYRATAGRGISPMADLYVPARRTGASVILVHGGGFVIGSRRMKPMRYLASRLVSSGIAVCAIDYRMMFRGGRLAEASADVCDAIDFWSERAGREGLDPRAISIAGLSAGGTLAMLSASLRASSLAGLVCAFGLYDIDHLQGPLTSLLPRLLFGSSERSSWHDRTPCGAAQPPIPTLLLHGSEDGLVPVDQARRLAAVRDAQRLPTKLVVYAGAPHGFFNAPCEAAEAAVEEIIAHVTPRA